ncbi:enoyl-CoA hydratase-related protein, partial [uncultured Sphingomonas sp.]|uniref:enoyl-CoA hydratase-related protein n=1 Tax=uncultured Sphingomonas sp. TaxID=158754 RepID=UPI00374907CC
MTDPITTVKDGDVLIITSNNPPVNALGAAVRQGLDRAVKEGLADDGVKAMVIACEGKTFFAGADITEFGKPMQEPGLPTLVDSIEASDKPIVAAIHGTALGGGCEVALACHYRIAVPSAKLGLPEVKLGILPGAGGTQRLPRVAGVEFALELATKGDPVPAAKAQAAGLVDRLAGEDSMMADAIAYAREVADARPLPRASEKSVTVEPGVFDAFRKTNAKRFRGYDAPAEIISVIEETASLPYAAGVQRERNGFMKLIMGVQSAAQRHIFFAERKASKIDGVADDVQLRSIKRVGVIGAGTMGGGIAMSVVNAGIACVLLEVTQEALDAGLAKVRGNYDISIKRGSRSQAQVEAALRLLTSTLDYADLADCDLVIEAVFENMGVKKEIFGTLDRVT